MNRPKQITIAAVLLFLVSLYAIVATIQEILNEEALRNSGADSPGYLFLSVILVIFSISLVASYGLWQNQRWGKVLAIITQAINGLLALPGILFAPVLSAQISAVAGVVIAITIIVLVLWPTPQLKTA